MSCRHGEETFPCNQSSKYCLGCRIKKNKFPLIEEEEITTKDGAQIKKTKITKTRITKDGVLALTTTTTTTKDGVPEKTTTTTRKYRVPEKTTTTNDESQAKTATKEQGRGDFLGSARFLLLTSGSFYCVYKVFGAVSAFVNRKNDSF